MDSIQPPVRHISLIDSLAEEWLKLPFAVMREVGPAAQTLGGLLKHTNKETFVTAKDIAGKARLPLSTVRKHLVILHKHGWIENAGRERTRTGRARRTCTIKITQKTRDMMEPYACLPWWACCNISKVGRLPWSSKAVLSVVMARLMSLKAAAIESSPDEDFTRPAKIADGARRSLIREPQLHTRPGATRKWLDERDEELVGAIDNLGGDERFRFGLDELTRSTGLTRESVVSAKRWLKGRWLINWSGGDGHLGGDWMGANCSKFGQNEPCLSCNWLKLRVPFHCG